MNIPQIGSNKNAVYRPLPKDFNKKKSIVSFGVVNNPILSEIQNLGRGQCLSKKEWPHLEQINAWMITAETATFMKWGGLGVVASELPEAFNTTFAGTRDRVSIVTPMYIGDTGKKAASFDGKTYFGAQKNNIELTKILGLKVPFIGAKGTLVQHPVDVYSGTFNGITYIFLQNERFFSINPHPNNNPAQDGCYILNSENVNEVERFAFFSKAVYCLIKHLVEKNKPEITIPNILVANDWHSGALSGLLKYFTLAQVEAGTMTPVLADKLKNIPVIHLAHHLGYQGWDYEHTAHILNSSTSSFSLCCSNHSIISANVPECE